MKRSLVYQTMLWIVATAHLSLLAHAFVPHHHHGGGAAFLNIETCPHEHGHHRDAHDGCSTETPGDCETLKRTLLQNWGSDDYRFDLPILLLFGNFQPTGPIAERRWSGLTPAKVPWLVGQLSAAHKASLGLRGPPAIIFA